MAILEEAKTKRDRDPRVVPYTFDLFVVLGQGGLFGRLSRGCRTSVQRLGREDLY